MDTNQPLYLRRLLVSLRCLMSQFLLSNLETTETVMEIAMYKDDALALPRTIIDLLQEALPQENQVILQPLLVLDVAAVVVVVVEEVISTVLVGGNNHPASIDMGWFFLVFFFLT